MRKVELRLFGAFRKFSAHPSIEIQVPERSTVAEFRSLLPSALAGPSGAEVVAALVSQSAIASETEILLDESYLPAQGSLAILPPVCGG